MKAGVMIKRLQKAVVRNSPSLLTGVAIGGIVTTAYFAAKASWKAAEIVAEEEAVHGRNPNRKERYKHNAKLVWKEYVPAVATGGITIASVVGSSRVSAKRGAAAHAAFVLSERAFSEYRERVIEEIGVKKDQKIRDDIAEKKVKANPPSEMLISGPGNILCCELFTGRYFTSDMETLRKAVNQLNQDLLKHDRASLEDWYDIIGLRNTSFSKEIGWMSDRLMDLEFTTLLTEDGRPCLAFDYNYTRPIHGGFLE